MKKKTIKTIEDIEVKGYNENHDMEIFFEGLERHSNLFAELYDKEMKKLQRKIRLLKIIGGVALAVAVLILISLFLPDLLGWMN